MTHDIMEHVRVTQELLQNELSFATVTLLSIRGSAPQIAGAKAIITEDGLAAGTIGGGKIEAAAIEHARQMIRSTGDSTQLLTWNLQTEIGMTCGGEVTLFFEVVRKVRWPIAIFGAGHVAQSLVRILLNLNCKITCIDSRSEWLAKLPDHPKLSKLCIENPYEVVDSIPENAFFVLMSKGHTADLPVLKQILLTHSPPYLGVIGSKQKAKALKRDLHNDGIDEEKQNSFFCPIGLPLGDNTTSEIAISIAAQLIKIRDDVGVFEHRKKDFG